MVFGVAVASAAGAALAAGATPGACAKAVAPAAEKMAAMKMDSMFMMKFPVVVKAVGARLVSRPESVSAPEHNVGSTLPVYVESRINNGESTAWPRNTR